MFVSLAACNSISDPEGVFDEVEALNNTEDEEVPTEETND